MPGCASKIKRQKEHQARGRAVAKSSDSRFWESQDFSITKSIVQEGNHHQDQARFGANCQVKISDINVSGLTLKELTQDFFYTKYFNVNHSGQIILGGPDSEIDRTLERLLVSMFPGEVCQAAMRIKLDNQRNSRELLELKQVWVDLECQINLEMVLNAQPLDKWYPETKVEKARELNEAAIRLFKTQRFLDAFHQFRATLRLLVLVLGESEIEQKKKENELPEDLWNEAHNLKLTCYSNVSACQFQWGNYGYVIQIATKVLRYQPDNVKMLYRRGVSYLERKEFPEAKSDLTTARRLEPDNRAVNDKVGQLLALEKRHNQALAGNMKKMFG